MKTAMPCYQPKQALLFVVLPLICFIAFKNESSAQVNHLVISQVYGGGGGGGATYKSDFVELFNPTNFPVNLNTYTVQYQSPTGNSWTSTGALTGSIAPGRYYLIQLNTGNSGSVLPSPDFSAGIDLNASDGKVALVNSTTLLTSCSSNSIVDKVGYGNPNVPCNEIANASGISKTTSIFRADYGYTDTDNNVADFSINTPNARNSGSPGVGPTITMGSATAISASSATLNGTVNAHGSTTTTSLFKYGTTISYGNSVNTSPSTISGYTATNVTAAISGLTANTMYHYQITAANGIATSNSSDATFITLPNAPVMSTASAIKTTGFTANWAAPASGGVESFTYTVEVADNPSFSTIITGSSNISATTTSWVVAGLISGNTYYYRVKAINATGSSVYSATSAAVTTSIRVPTSLTVTTQPVGPNVSGGILVTQPQVTVKDQDGAVMSNVGVNAAVTSGQGSSWTLGGIVSITTDKSGVAAFTNLSATNNTSTAFSATLTFTPVTGSGSAISANFIIPPPPANDECANAIALSVSNSVTCNTLTQGTTAGATQSLPSSTGTADDDVWYSFTATSNTHTIIITTGQGGLSNPVFQTFGGSCADLKDSGYTTNNVRNFKGLIIGRTYYIRVFGYANGTGQGSFTICITTPVSSVDVSSSGQVAAGAINLNTTVNTISRFQLFPSNVANTLTAVKVSLEGSYTAADISNCKLFYNTVSSLTGATQFGGTVTPASTGSGEIITFTGNLSLANLSTYYYFFVTADVRADATPGRKINTSVITSSNFSFTNANTSVSGQAEAAGVQTVTTTAPVLTAAPNATVDNPFIITFNEKLNFRNNITSVSFDGNALPATAYDKTVTGQITFKPAQSSYLQTTKTANIIITSTGYEDAVVSQILNPGVATHLAIVTQPSGPANNGYALIIQPVIKIADKYENAAKSAITVTAAATQPVWMLGGTQIIQSTSGIATYTNLTASSTTALAGATITFSCSSFSSVVSNPFAIPGLSPAAGEIVINQLNPQYDKAADEYIELVNTTDKTFDLNTLTIKYASSSGSGGVDKPMSGTLLPHSFCLRMQRYLLALQQIWQAMAHSCPVWQPAMVSFLCNGKATVL